MPVPSRRIILDWTQRVDSKMRKGGQGVRYIPSTRWGKRKDYVRLASEKKRMAGEGKTRI
jgi:hypothetical protein